MKGGTLTGTGDGESKESMWGTKKRSECRKRRAVQKCSPPLAQGRCHFKHKWWKKKKKNNNSWATAESCFVLLNMHTLVFEGKCSLAPAVAAVHCWGGQTGCSSTSLVPCKQRSPGIIIAYFQHGILQIRSLRVLPKHTSESRHCSAGWLPAWRWWQSPQSLAFCLWLSHVQPMAQLRTSSSNTMRIHFYAQTVWGVSVIRFVKWSGVSVCPAVP